MASHSIGDARGGDEQSPGDPFAATAQAPPSNQAFQPRFTARTVIWPNPGKNPCGSVPVPHGTSEPHITLAVMTPPRLFIACATIITAVGAMASPAVFPGPVARFVDPTGQFQIGWAEPNGGSSHQLFFADVGSPNGTPVLSFDRSVAVVWAPNGNAFAVTKNKGSDNSEVLVFAVPPKQPTQLVLVFPAGVRRLIAANHHAYLDVVTWDREGLTIHAHGYGDTSPNGFSVHVHCQKRHEGWFCR